MPDLKTFAHTFDRISEVVEHLLAQTGFTRGLSHAGLWWTRGLPHPQPPSRGWKWLILQNTNAYEEGFTSAWDQIRHSLWENPGPETEALLRRFSISTASSSCINTATKRLSS